MSYENLISNINELYNYLENYLESYLIDNNIIITNKNEKDNNYNIIYIKYILLKYRRVIALILLIILLLIGYCCEFNFNFDSVDSIDNVKTKNIKQTGGSQPEQAPAAEPAAAPKKSIKEKIKHSLAVSKEMRSQKISKVTTKLGNIKNKIVDPSTYTKGVKSSITGIYDAGAASARSIKNNAGFVYEILYSVALFVIICVLFIPSIAFFAVGIVCYFLLKDKMKAFKAL